MRTITAFFLFLMLTFGIQAQDVSISSVRLDSLINNKPYPSIEILIDSVESIKNKSIEDGDTLTLTKCLLYQSSFYARLSDYANLSRVILECNNIAKDTSVVPVTDYISSLNNGATLEKLKGNHKKANEIYFKILDLEKKSANRPKTLAKYYYNLSLNFSTIGDYKNALTTIGQCLNYATGSRVLKGHIIQGFVYHNLEDYPKAIESLLVGLNMLEEKESLNKANLRLVISGYQELTKSYLKDRQLALAKQSLIKVKKYQETLPYRIYKTKEIEGQILLTEKKYKPAILQIRGAVAEAEKQYESSREYPVIARLYKELGDLYVITGKLDTGLLAYQKGLTYFDNEIKLNIIENPDISKVNATTEVLDLLHAKASATRLIYDATEKDSDFTVSQNAYAAAIALIDKMKEDFITETSKFFVVERSNIILNEAMELFSMEYNRTKNPKLLNDIFLIMEKNKGGILFQSIKRKFDLLQSGLPSHILELESDLKANISFQNKLLLKEQEKPSPDSSRIIELTNALYEYNEKYTIHKQSFSKNHKEFYNFTEDYIKEVSLNKIQQLIDKETAIVEYFASDKNLFILTIQKNNIHFESTPYENISKAVQKHRTLISTKPSETSNITDLFDHSRELSKKLLNSTILENTTSLIIIPDGVLSQIPFESLMWNKSNQYLLEKFNVGYHYSVKQFINNEKVQNSRSNVLSLAPQFGKVESETRSCHNETLGNLKHAKDEAIFISENFDSKLITSDSTNIRHLTENIKNYNIIHLATHACINTSAPMLSEIHFNDGTLTNYDIQNLNVRPELVVLSACNTGQGEIEEGEGIISLSRGFLEAGVKSIQSSLWSIDDYASSEIIKEMYLNLKKGQMKSEALRNSKLAYLSKSDKRRSHPYFWAGIVHIGNDNPLFSSFNYGYLLLFLGLGILVLGLFFLLKK